MYFQLKGTSWKIDLDGFFDKFFFDKLTVDMIIEGLSYVEVMMI